MAAVGSGSASQDFSIRVPGVIASAQGIDEVNNDIKNAVAALKAEGDAVVNGSWTGAAASKLDEGWQQWQDGIHKIVATLEQTTGLVFESTKAFQRADETGQ